MTESTGIALLTEAVRRGVHVVWADRPRFRGPTPALALAKQAPETASEVLRRAAIFRQRQDAWVASGRFGVPLLTLPEVPLPTAGTCISCGTPVDQGRTWRCALCLLALNLVLNLKPLEP